MVIPHSLHGHCCQQLYRKKVDLCYVIWSQHEAHDGTFEVLNFQEMRKTLLLQLCSLLYAVNSPQLQ